ncbi:unnamed protein product [Cercospora beticola]|nr:unnamed protein product [Cercospora beticola]
MKTTLMLVALAAIANGAAIPKDQYNPSAAHLQVSAGDPHHQSPDQPAHHQDNPATAGRTKQIQPRVTQDPYGPEPKDSDILTAEYVDGIRYVSYGALQRNSVPCSRRGASYYNCKQSGQANTYGRGCNQNKKCRSSRR